MKVYTTSHCLAVSILAMKTKCPLCILESTVSIEYSSPETECYLMVIFTMRELVLLSVRLLCTLYSTGNVSSEYTPPGAS